MIPISVKIAAVLAALSLMALALLAAIEILKESTKDRDLIGIPLAGILFAIALFTGAVFFEIIPGMLSQ